MNQQNLEHVTFRPGNLAERLVVGPLSPGATAKRSLWRYYALLDAEIEEWMTALEVSADAMIAIRAFIDTRYWEAIPETIDFWRQFASFARSPLAARFVHATLVEAADALKSATRTCLVALIDLAEASPAAATADATSAAS